MVYGHRRSAQSWIPPWDRVRSVKAKSGDRDLVSHLRSTVSYVENGGKVEAEAALSDWNDYVKSDHPPEGAN
jgi:hypothetical protein